MIETLGPYILVLILNLGGGLAMQEFSSFAACKAAVVQLESIRFLSGYCIAKEVKP
jgi:hypothetical protein